jgi:hypothetical protein
VSYRDHPSGRDIEKGQAMKPPRSLLVLVLAAALAVAGCGDDSDDEGAAPRDTPADVEDITGDAPDVDPCSLLEVSEIDAEFGAQGTVLDGQDQGDQCLWEVGEDQTALGTGTVSVFVQYVNPELPIAPIDDIFADQQASYAESTPVDGIGDEAYFEPNGATVNVRSGDLIWFVQAAFIPQVDGVQEKLEALAGLVAVRL